MLDVSIPVIRWHDTYKNQITINAIVLQDTPYHLYFELG